jgi:polyisoprenoid-binding protein YceI
MKKSLVAGAALALLSVSAALSSAQAQGTSDASSFKAGAYKVESYHTQVTFSVLHFGFTNFSGFFSGASGTLQFDPANLAASKLEVTIPISSVKTTVAKLDGELVDPTWFDAAKYPSATFTSTKITPAGKGGATVTGNLTLHGVTKPVTLNVKFIGAGVNPIDKAYTVGFEATGTIKRSEFGVSQYVPGVGDDVRLNIAGAFEKQS